MERYETYKDSGVEWIGEIPEHWSMHPLRAHSTMIVPMRDKPTSFDGDIPWIRIEDFDGKYIKASKSQQNVSRELIAEMNLKVYPTGTVLCSCSCNLGVCAIVEKPLCSNQTFIGCVPTEYELNSSFLFYLMGSMERRLNYLSSGTIQTYLSRHDFEHLSVQVPPIEEQRTIADYLDAKTAEIDVLVEDCEREVELLREYRKAVISEAVTKGLDPDAPMKDSGVEWIGEIPEGWSVVPYKAIVLVAANLQHPEDYPNLPQVAPDRIEKDTGRLLPCQTVDEVGVESDNHLFNCGDVLYSKVRPALNKVTVAPFDGMCSADMYPIRSNQNHRWLMYFMLSNAFMEQVIVSTDRVKMPKVNKEELGTFKVVLPPIAQQVEIAAFLDDKTTEIDSLIEAKRQMAEKLREYRKSLISEAVTGKFKVPEVQ